MDKVFLKIIIPNYNNIAYLPKCLDSILSQTFQDFKIILVDDQSTDFSYELAKTYEKAHPDKLIVLKAPTKCHEGGARNIGINYNKIQCDYIYFVDSDDYLYNENVLQIIFDNLKNKPDILLFNMIQLIGNKYIPVGAPNIKFDFCSKNLALSKWNSASAKVVKSSIIVPFLENCDHGADAYQFICLMDKQPTIKQIEDIIYVYRRHLNSLTCTTNNTRYIDDTALFYSKLGQLLFSLKTESVKQAVNYRLELFNNGVIDK